MTETKRTFTLRAIVQMILVVVVAPLIPMIISGQWNWWQAWAYAVASTLAFVVSRILVNRRHPDLIAERARFTSAKDTKAWDKLLAPLVGLGSVLILAVAGLDKYCGWTPASSLTFNLIALFGILFGYGFSSTVRIQTERGHHVVSTGPYRIVRHPGYAGGLFGYIFIPLLLDSYWAWIPTILLGIALIVRTSLEDKTLQEELPGYKEFAQKTKYRLLPGIW
ncbi:MAG: isoprenylcysteine carboxylmethyltransferase family protein [Anaerolineales bacterium]